MATGLFNLKQVNQAISQGAWSGYIAPKWVEYLVVAGGGGGGTTGGGGGAGGLLTGIVTVAAGTSYTVTVGTGGAGSTNYNATGVSGVASVFGSISATGGGGAGSNAPVSGLSGGSGGGAGSSGFLGTGGQGVTGQGNSGSFNSNSASNYGAGGGGGAGTAGLNGLSSAGGNGGAGIASAISGLVSTYAGGGGGGSQGGTAGVGGVGGGGGGTNSVSTAASGSANTGGGGGGGGYSSNYGNGGNGGSGIVVVRYPGSVQFFTGGTLSYANGYMIHTFYASGTLAPTTPTPYVTDYQISRSLRFNRSDSTYLTRTPSSTGSRTTFTLSLWLKLGNFTTGNDSVIWASGDATSGDAPTLLWKTFDGTCSFVFNAGTSTDLKTTSVYRDPSAWYHVVLAVDTTQATASNRIKMYVNGVQVTAFSTATYPSQNLTYNVNTSSYPAYLGCLYAAGYIRFWEGYQTEVNFIDGQQLTPSSFGYTNPATGVWSPLAFVGTYGTNGFELNFSDNSNTTAATLGKDYSGNSNNWTPNNFSVTAGAGNDSLVDSPTSYGTDTGVGGTVRGNYAVLNPLKKKSVATISNGNLSLASTGATAYVTGLSTISPSSGYFYMEMTCAGSNLERPWGIGFVETTAADSATIATSQTFMVTNGTGSNVVYLVGPTTTATLSTTTTWAAGDVISLAWDATSTTNKMWVGRNGVWYPSTTGGTVATNADVAAGNYPTFTISNAANTNPQLFPAVVTYGTAATVDVNFGQRPFAYTAPSGFKALCTQNLPTPTIGATTATQAGKYFNTVTWIPSGQTTVTGVGFQPDFTWWKNRNSEFHVLADVLRGNSAYLKTNSSDAEATASNLWVTNSDGWTSASGTMTNGNGYVGWNWKANGSGSTNTSGTITSTVSANTTSGFSVVTYTGTGSNATVGHGLGVAPSFIIVKRRDAGSSWNCYQISLGASQYIQVDGTGAAATNTGVWNNTAPTSSVFSIGTAFAGVNAAGSTHVAYCFAPVAGFSAFGSYTGNGSSDGTFVYLGFRPAYMMIKASNAVDNWVIMDVARNPYNAVNYWLQAESSAAEATLTPPQFDFNSNGMKLRGTSSSCNGSGVTYIYMAFASNPFKYSLAR